MLDPSMLDSAFRHRHHIWDVEKVKSLLADKGHRLSFFCGGSRNFHSFIKLFDEVFVLDVDIDTLKRRLSERPQDEFGGKPDEQEFVLKLHCTKEEMPSNATIIDATVPLVSVVDDILSRCDPGGHNMR
ncbi:hypothetical protein FHT91_000240 [Rhizobium sp. BK347]|nr:hypothetical protein [Rhizobium sp. BK252]MBB3400022.1 hypothetical protein [Rhizobium sp. BK289]MBB3412602.1 hypothetical protein [Rhizobium sp. BK284]MBB3480488.1 hypothetical protein [Rhizobium sp. BK347]